MQEVIVTSIRPGAYVSVDRGIWEVKYYEHHKPGKGGAVARIKIKNVETGAALEKTYDADAKIARVEVDEHPSQFLFRAGDTCTFMNLESFEQVEIPVGRFEDQAMFLKQDLEVKIVECEGKVLGVRFPNSVDLKVVETPPGVKGDTVSRGTKQAKLEGGATVNVPLFINPGEVIRVDTRTGEYVERAS